MPYQTIGIIANTGKPGAPELIRKLSSKLEAAGCRVVIETRTADLVGVDGSVPLGGIGGQCDLALILGGDGTMLSAVRELGDAGIPVFGINLGSLGFLTGVSSHEFERAVDALLGERTRTSHRTRLDLEVHRAGRRIVRQTGLNDAVVSRGQISRLVRMQVEIDGDVLTEYNADGLIVATPTGSTAYSLSAGGPILLPDTRAFVITPICPHVLTNRSVILSDEAHIRITPCEGQKDLYLTMDGQELVQIQEHDTIHIRKADTPLRLVMLEDVGFSEILRQKLRWSGSSI